MISRKYFFKVIIYFRKDKIYFGFNSRAKGFIV